MRRVAHRGADLVSTGLRRGGSVLHRLGSSFRNSRTLRITAAALAGMGAGGLCLVARHIILNAQQIVNNNPSDLDSGLQNLLAQAIRALGATGPALALCVGGLVSTGIALGLLPPDIREAIIGIDGNTICLFVIAMLNIAIISFAGFGSLELVPALLNSHSFSEVLGFCLAEGYVLLGSVVVYNQGLRELINNLSGTHRTNSRQMRTVQNV